MHANAGPQIDFGGDMAVLDAAAVAKTPNCTLEAAARAAVWGNGATAGVLVIAAPDQVRRAGPFPSLSNHAAAQLGQPLRPLGTSAFEDQDGVWDGNDAHGFCSMLPRHPALLAVLAAAGAKAVPLQVTFVSRPVPGRMLLVDLAGTVGEAGAATNPTLDLVAAAMQNLQFVRAGREEVCLSTQS